MGGWMRWVVGGGWMDVEWPGQSRAGNLQPRAAAGSGSRPAYSAGCAGAQEEEEEGRRPQPAEGTNSALLGADGMATERGASSWVGARRSTGGDGVWAAQGGQSRWVGGPPGQPPQTGTPPAVDGSDSPPWRQDRWCAGCKWKASKGAKPPSPPATATCRPGLLGACPGGSLELRAPTPGGDPSTPSTLRFLFRTCKSRCTSANFVPPAARAVGQRHVVAGRCCWLLADCCVSIALRCILGGLCGFWPLCPPLKRGCKNLGTVKNYGTRKARQMLFHTKIQPNSACKNICRTFHNPSSTIPIKFFISP